MLENMAALLDTYFFNISLNVIRPTFASVYNLPFLRKFLQISIKLGLTLGQKLFFLLYELLHQENCSFQYYCFH